MGHDSLILINLPPQSDVSHFKERGDFFVLQTCLRTLVATLNEKHLFECHPQTLHKEIYKNDQAYSFLLEVICGLKSELLGENEIAKQFKDAYRLFAGRENKDTTLLKILEKGLKASKEVRTKFLNFVGQHSYASLTRKILIEKLDEDAPVLVLGNGNLALDIIKQIQRHFLVTICGRNNDKIRSLAGHLQIKQLEWNFALEINAGEFPFIVNTIGTDDEIFSPGFFHNWAVSRPSGFLIDLAAPALLNAELLPKNMNVTLSHILERSSEEAALKKELIFSAQVAIKLLTQKQFPQKMEACTL